ncbi:quinate pathway repressor protein QutR [Aspergillus sclerotioniger CBS 115572]|uniref:Quinate pathway repressor protein QutR n=1 Tax=Aspergillus sclerotioniger CBS 115572 TaxID=1450535 RepID=A0A317VJ39_9EURO|nr:quinate pathway repressor protein QutR [Aspergillus sclerotioniger CBS 115572]PWY73207.1 quinate pathway repressor protein QutR [Aspergillus sclerotioniger CBS 115572]
MSILVKPPKRKLDELEGPVEQNSRRLSHSPFTSNASHAVDPTYGDDAPRPRVNSAPQTEHSETSHWFSLRELNSNRQSPASFEGPFQAQRKFSPNASIVLTGIRGTGKSSLAVILAATSGRRLIDADRYFQQVTGRSRASYKKEFDLVEYRQQEARVMESMLTENQEGCVIACGPGSMERSGQTLLREYAKTHPVIYILRDPESIQSYLKAWNTDKVRRFLELSGPIYRACSNLEFFNVSEKGIDQPVPKDTHDSQWEAELDQRVQAITPFLTLKQLQRDFLCFIAFATGDATDLSRHNSSFPLSMQPVESRTYTYAVNVPISSMFERDLDIEELESTADAFELKLDVAEPPSSHLGLDSSFADKTSQAVANIRRHTVVPLIYHVESTVSRYGPGAEQKDPLRRSDAEYLKMVQHGLRLAPEFVTVDLSYEDNVLSQIIASKGSSKAIGHFAATQPPARGWDDAQYMELYERAKRLGCDMVRLTQPAVTIDDNFAVQRFRDYIKSLPAPQLPVIAYNSGLLGRLSCCFNPILTPITHPSLLSEMQSKGLPCITLREAQEALYSSFTLDPLQFFVFGANITYSLSPAMHNAAYARCGMPHQYKLHQSSSLRGLNELVENANFGGTSVSLPYKTEAIPLLHSMSPHARAIGAVNTLIPIRRLEDKALGSDNSSLYMEKSRAGPIKALHGDNTDWIGMGNCFRRGLSPANAIRPSSTGLVIGAGGMARAAIYSMIHLGVQNIFIFNRTVASAEKLAYHYNRQNLPSGRAGSAVRPRVHVIRSLQESWPASYKQPTVICSCIPTHSIGGQPAPNFEMPVQWLESPTGGVVVELAYKTLNTPLMKQIRALSHRGWVALDGLDVLPEQGFAQFELFTGRRAPRRLMRMVVLKEYEGEEGQYDDRVIKSRIENLEGQPT